MAPRSDGVSAVGAADLPAELATGAFFFAIARCLSADAAAAFLFFARAALTLARFNEVVRALDGAPRPAVPAGELADAGCLPSLPAR